MSDDEKDEKDERAPSGELVEAFKKGTQFTEDLLKENERLRYKVAELESRTDGSDESLVKELVAKVGRLEDERDGIVARFAEVEALNIDFNKRYAEVESENNKLLNLYIASYQLHATLDYEEVLRTIVEIVLNFVGAEAFSVAMISEDGSNIHPLITEGISEDDARDLPLSDGVVGQALGSGVAYFAEEIDGQKVNPREPLAAIPLRIKDGTTGVIAVYKFLQQKVEWSSLDRELFAMLAGHAATAIFASKLYTDTSTELKSMQRMIDLVTRG